MSALAAVSLWFRAKMIWQFGNRMGFFYFSVIMEGKSPSDGTSGDCKLDTKPQPQWIGNGGESNRSKIYMIGQNDYDENNRACVFRNCNNDQ
jgi:hypothetical protein